MKPIVLTGMSGSGKSTAGELTAKNFNLSFIDIDSEIEKFENKKISEIFELKGEKYFRNIEKNIIFNSLNYNIISLGGGAFQDKQTRDFLLENSTVIYLEASPKIIYERLKNTSNRPLLKNINIEKICSILNTREKNYKLAHIKIMTDNKKIEDIIEEIATCAGLK